VYNFVHTTCLFSFRCVKDDKECNRWSQRTSNAFQ